MAASLVVVWATVTLGMAARVPVADAAVGVTATPSSGVGDGQTVYVDITGFKTPLVRTRLCKGGATSLDDCSPVGVYLTPDQDGNAHGYLVVRAGEHPSRTGSFTCDAGHPCSVVAADGDPPNLVAFASFTFASNATTTTAPTAPDNPSCPIPPVSLRVGGSSTANEAMKRWAQIVCQPNAANLPLDFTSSSSPDGRAHAIDASVDIGISDTPFLPGDQGAFELGGKQASDFVFVPILASGLEINARFPLSDNDADTTFLRRVFLDPAASAAVLNGVAHDSVTPAFARANETNLDFPKIGASPIFRRFADPILRAERDGETYLLTSWFYSDSSAKAVWEQPPIPEKGPTENFPSLAGVNLRAGAYNVAQTGRLPDGEGGRPFSPRFFPANSSLSATDDPLSFPPAAGQVSQSQLAHAYLKNPSGRFVAPTADAITKGLQQMKDNGDGTYAPVFTTAGGWHDADAYPLPVVTYAILPKKIASAELYEWSKKFVEYAVGDGQKVGNLPPGYVPLPTAMAAQAKTQFALIEGPADPTTTTTTDPSSEGGDSGGDQLSSDGGLIDASGFSDDSLSSLGSYDGTSGGSGDTGAPLAGGGTSGGSISSGGSGSAAGSTAGSGSGNTKAGNNPTGPKAALAALLNSAALSPAALAIVGFGLLLGGPLLRAWDRRRKPYP